MSNALLLWSRVCKQIRLTFKMILRNGRTVTYEEDDSCIDEADKSKTMNKEGVRTRKKTSHFLYGEPSELPIGQLPTAGDVLRLVWLYRSRDRDNNILIRSIINDAAIDIAEFWEKAIGDRTTVPIISLKSIQLRLQRLYTKSQSLMKSKQPADVEKFNDSLLSLFDLCSCSCPTVACGDVKCNEQNCRQHHLQCRCAVKVPKREIQFLIDQRTNRRMYISTIDWPTTGTWKRRQIRDEKEEELDRRQKQKLTEDTYEVGYGEDDYEDESDVNASELLQTNMEVDDEYLPQERVVSAEYNTLPLPKLALICDRQVSKSWLLI